MSEKKFKFVSPGVFLNEIDNSQLPKTSDAVGPVVIGRATRGPGLKPVRVESFSEFVEIFGKPEPGGDGEDVWRQGNGFLAPTYAGYAVQAYLRNSSPVNFVRLMGIQDPDAKEAGYAGWISKNNTDPGAWGIFVGRTTPAAPGYQVQFTATAGDTLGSASKSLTVRLPAKASPHTVTSIQFQIVNNGVDVSDAETFSKIEKDAGDTSTGVSVANGFKTALEGAFDVSCTVTASGGGKAFLTIVPSTGKTGRSYAGTLVPANADTAAFNTATEGANFTTSFSGSYANTSSAHLAAVVYANHATSNGVKLKLKGPLALMDVNGDQSIVEDSNTLVAAENKKFNLVIENASGTSTERIPVSFDSSSPDFIRKALNTNPTVTNSSITTSEGLKQYWLGQSYEHFLQDPANDILSGAGEIYGFVTPLSNDTKEWDDWRLPLKEAKTGWFFSQNLAATGSFEARNQQKLFKFCSINEGESNHRDFKISIMDIKPPAKGGVNKYGSFTVLVRKAEDTDNAPQVVERFSSCNLNPLSSDYIGRKIGDVYQEWVDSEKRYRFYGDHANMSKYIRVEVNSDVHNGVVEPSLLPFGVFGPPVFKDIPLTLASGGTERVQKSSSDLENTWLKKSYLGGSNNTGDFLSGSAELKNGHVMTLKTPTTRTRVSGSDGGMVNASKAFFGLQTTRNKTTTRHDESYVDLVRHVPADWSANNYAPDETATGNQQYSWIFTLDDIVIDGNSVYYESGSHSNNNRGDGTARAGMNYTASYTADHGYEALLRTKEINRFTSPMFGGFDGVDITEADPFNNRELALAAGSATDKYEYASVKRALDAVSDAEVVECNMIAMPGITEETLNTTMVRNAEARADSLAIIDLPDVYTPPHERTASTFKERVADSVQQVVDVFTNRGINSSYGCTYYPWVKIYDETSDAQLWVPPSIPAMGVMANTERRSALWFAPAGFNRGGLTEGSAGISVIGVTERLAAKDRDKLYEVNINPIASFPAEGIVIFGQKTLQITQSALDRINVRRLMIFVKKRVSRIANSLLFDQNVQATWDRFTGQVQPFLETVKQGFGLTDFKVILDSSTTTPDLIDRNILYAKIFLKPARSIEFIAVDFVITNTGAAFED